MAIKHLLEQMGAGDHPSDDEIESAQRIAGEMKEEAGIGRGIKRCRTITELIDYLRTIPGIQGSKKFYSREVLVSLVSHYVGESREFESGAIRKMSVEAIARMMPKVTNQCGLRDKLAKLIHELAL